MALVVAYEGIETTNVMDRMRLIDRPEAMFGKDIFFWNCTFTNEYLSMGYSSLSMGC